MESQQTYTLPQTNVDSSCEDANECTYSRFQTHENSICVEEIDPHLAWCEQDGGVISTSKNVEVNLTAEEPVEEHLENSCPDKWNEKAESLSLPEAEDILSIKVDSSREDGIEYAYNLLQTHKNFIPVEGGDPHSASCSQDAVVGSTSLTIKVNMAEEEQAEICYPYECNNKVASSFLPQAKDILSIKRRKRYFDSGLEDHKVDLPPQKRSRPCYLCGELQHGAKRCPKRRACYFCKGIGHFVVNCPVNVQDCDRICLKCGETGHEMSSCNNGYCPEDLSKVHCYACNELGHLFCGSLLDISPKDVSCFNCGKIGHTGQHCPKQHLKKHGSHPPSKSFGGGQDALSREDVDLFSVDRRQTHKYSIPVDAVDPHLASCGQDVAVDSSKNYGMKLTEEEQSENSYLESNRKLETVLFPKTDMSPIKIYGGNEGLFEETSISILQQQSPNKNISSLTSVPTKSASVSAEHTVLQKFSRRKRYFDFGNSDFEHHIVNPSAQTQCKPCYFCGQLQHDAKRCPKRRTCYFCKGKGHFSVDCPIVVKAKDRVCLKCGEIGHEMLSCNNDYCLDDLSKIQCYTCNELGHIFCGSLLDISPEVVSCFNCGETRHPGLECPKPHVENFGLKPPAICYKCGETGHAALKCRNDGKVSGSCEDRQGTAQEGDDTDVYQNRKRARRQRAYKHGRLKKQKFHGPLGSTTV